MTLSNGKMMLEASGRLEKLNIYLLDTNSIIHALNHAFKFPTYTYLVSVITEIELLSYDQLTKTDENILKKALSNFKNINICNEIKTQTINIRYNTK